MKWWIQRSLYDMRQPSSMSWWHQKPLPLLKVARNQGPWMDNVSMFPFPQHLLPYIPQVHNHSNASPGTMGKEWNEHLTSSHSVVSLTKPGISKLPSKILNATLPGMGTFFLNGYFLFCYWWHMFHHHQLILHWIHINLINCSLVVLSPRHSQ